jgi:hypothetical protein
MRTGDLLAVVIMVAAASTAAAQPLESDAAERTLAAPANLPLGAIAGVPPGARGSALQLILDATDDQKVGTVALGWKSGQQDHFLLTLSGPLDESTNRAAPLSLIGLASGAAVKFSGNRLNWRGPNLREQAEIQQLCEALAKRKISPCQTDNEEIPLIERDALRRLTHLDDTPWLVGGEVGIERAGYEFLESGTLAARSENHQNWSIGARLGHYSPVYGFLIGSYSYHRGHIAAGLPADVCVPIDGTAALRCESSVIGEPGPTKLSVAGVEVRKFFASPVAIAPSVRHDFVNDVTAVDVPMYFLRSGASLTGGVRVGWRSDTDEATAVVFVGTAISLLP